MFPNLRVFQPAAHILDQWELAWSMRSGSCVNAGARLHRFPEQRCINNADENALEQGLASWASGWGRDRLWACRRCCGVSAALALIEPVAITLFISRIWT